MMLSAALACSVIGSLQAGPTFFPGAGYQGLLRYAPTGRIIDVREPSLEQCLARVQQLMNIPGYQLVSQCKAQIFSL